MSIDKQIVTNAVNGLLAGDLSSAVNLFDARGCAPPDVQLDPAIEKIDGDRLAFLHQYWKSLQTTYDIPNSSKIDPVEMVPVLGYIALVDVLDDGWQFRYRLFGSSLVELFGYDMTGRHVSDLPGPSDVAYFFTATYRAALLLRRPVATAHVPSPAVGAQCWRRIILPLADDTGAVARFLVGNTPIGWRVAERGLSETLGSPA